MFDISSLRGPQGAATETADGDGVYDVVIIGGGPAGASAALYAARSGLRTVVLDKSAVAGALAITSKIANYPGVPGVVTGMELLETMRGQAASFGAEFRTAQALSADLNSDPKEVNTSEGPVKGKVVMIATGKMGRKNRAAGEEEFLGRGVSYCATCDSAFFKDRTVAVIGSSQEAVEEALFLTRFARRLFLVSPGDKLHGEPEQIAELEANPNVEIRKNRSMKEVLGGDEVTGIRLSGKGGDERLHVDGVFVYLPGNMPIIDFLEGAVETTEQGCVLVDRERATKIPGVYAIGDVLCSFIQQAVVAAADGAIAAMAAEKYIRGRARAKSDWG